VRGDWIGSAGGAGGGSRQAAPLLLILVFGVLVGCTQLPETRYYVLEIDRAGAAAAAGTDAVPASASGAAAPLAIGVRPFLVDPPYDQERIVYRVGERSPEVGFYAYHLWAAPLSAMLPTAVAAGLSGAAGVHDIEPVASGRRYDAHLLGRVLAVEEIDLDDRQLVRTAIELRLVAPDGAELWTDVIDARGETRTGDVGQIVEAIGRALEGALGAARERLGRAVAGLAR